MQSLLALGSGGIFGLGLGASRQKFFYLPEAHTDFIFAVVGEELGMLGTMIVLALFAAFAIRAFMLAQRTTDRFGFFIIVGCALLIVIQAFINIGVVTSSWPVTGVPLPFISFGGTSLIVSLVVGGSDHERRAPRALAMRVSRRVHRRRHRRPHLSGARDRRCDSRRVRSRRDYEPRFFGNRDGLEAHARHDDAADVRAERGAAAQALAAARSRRCGAICSASFVALGALRAFRPVMVVATGGYVCFPVVVAARILRTLRLLRCGIALLEINVRPGLTNRLLAPLVDEVWTTYDASAPFFRGKAHRTGHAGARLAACAGTHPSRARLELGLAPERTTIVAMGGSQGARSINEAVAALVTRRTLGDDRQVLHVSGERDHAYMEAEERDVGANHVTLVAVSAPIRPTPTPRPTSRSRAPAHRRWPNSPPPARPRF